MSERRRLPMVKEPLLILQICLNVSFFITNEARKLKLQVALYCRVFTPSHLHRGWTWNVENNNYKTYQWVPVWAVNCFMTFRWEERKALCENETETGRFVTRLGAMWINIMTAEQTLSWRLLGHIKTVWIDVIINWFREKKNLNRVNLCGFREVDKSS